jgi:hypothetical protein
MADVGVWQPDDVPLSAATLVRLADAADSLEEPNLGLSPLEVATWGALMKLPADAWAPLLATESDEQLVRIAKALTVAEMRLPGWESGARSPVIVIVRELRRRNTYPKELTVWIKAHTTNRFLPHGSLADRL